MDDEDDVLKTNSDPFKNAAPEWVPLSQRNKQSQSSRNNASMSGHKSTSSQKKSKNNYELSEGTYEQGDDNKMNNYTYSTYTDDENDDGYFYDEEDDEEGLHDK